MEVFIAFNSLILLITLIINLTLAFYMLFNNKKDEANWAFAGVLFSVALWTLATLLFLRVPSVKLVLLLRRLTPVGSALVAGFLVYFSTVFPKRDHPLPKHVRFACLLPGFTFSILSIFSPLLIKGYIVQDPNYLFVGQPVWGPAYKYFSIYFLVYYFAGVLNLIRKYFVANQKEKLQLWYVLVGFILSGIVGVFLSLFLPLVGYTQVFTLGPVFTLFLAFFASYAIVRHGLLNVEDFMARGVITLAIIIGVIGTFWALLINKVMFLASFYVTLANVTLGMVVLVRNFRSSINRAFAYVAFILALWSYSIFGLWNAADPTVALFWARTAFVAHAFPGAFWYFSKVFPRQEKEISWFMRVVIFLPGVVFIPLMIGPWLIKNVELVSWGYNPVPGALFGVFIGYMVLYLSMGFISLIIKQFKAKGIERIQIRYIFLGFLGLVLIGLFTNLIIPGLFGNSQLTWVGPYSTLFFVGFSAYAIVRHRLMSIELVIQKGFTYTLATTLITGVYVLVVFLSEQLFREALGYSSFILIALAALAIALAFQPIVQFLQRTTSNLFFRRRYDYRKTLREASEAIASVIRLEELSNLIVRIFIQLIGVKEISFLLYDPVRGKYKSAPAPSVEGGEKYMKIEIDPTNPAVQLLKKRREVLVFYELEREVATMSQGEGVRGKKNLISNALVEMGKLEVAVWVPVISKEELVGFIAMGEKEGGGVFTSDDLALFSVLASQIAVALDNARLYEEVLTMKNYNEDVLQSMTNGVLTTDLRGNIITYNKMAEKITGYPIAEVIGRSTEEVFGAGGVVSTLVEKALRGRSNLRIEANLSNPQVGFVPVGVSATLLRDSQGKKMGVLLTLTDLTMVRELESRVRQSDKLAALGTMAAGMAHEIKNPLSSMKVLSQLMPLKFNDQEFRGKFQEIMPKEISRIDRIVENLLGFARASTPKFEEVRVQTILEENLDYFSNQIESAKLTLKKEIDDVPDIVADAAQLSQVFSNLILNAIQAMQGGGTLTVKLKKGSVVDGELQDVVLTVSDTGCGMSREQLNKLFEPFFTTKYGGTGLGLTISHSIIDGHGGAVSVKSAPGKGTTFVVTLPLAH